MLGDMGYTDKLQKLCALRGLDQSELASKVGLSKSSMSRILSGAQEPKLRLAYDLAKALGVTLDYLVDEESEVSPFEQRVMVTNDELTILKMVRVLGTEAAMNRLLNAPPGSSQVATDAKVAAQQPGTRSRNDARRGDSEID
jgi:putative transcriptional regulator